MNLNSKINDIINFIFDKFGMTEDFPEKPKLHIHDNVFGTLTFTDYERKVVNSPLLQRLTQITQMGLANFVYPGAVHNRFSHSLGVSHISAKIYRQLMESDTGRDKTNIKEDINTLKLAGLLHDIGHCPFSHVSDDVIKTSTHFNDIPKANIDSEICSRTGEQGDNKNIHEFLGFHLLKSNRVENLINTIYKCVPFDFELIPLCVTGNLLPFNNENGLCHQIFDDKYKTLLIKIINGFSDSDKIDYILRDSQFSGLPLPADIDRLISFFEIISHQDTYELGVSEKGARAFNLLLQSKTKMFPTVYQHHTTLACESLLVFGIIDAMRNVNEATVNIDTEKWHPIECGVDLLYYTDGSLLDYLRIIDNPISNDVVNRLLNRRHYRTIRRIFTWELRNELIVSRKVFREDLKNSGLFSDFQKLLDEGKMGQYTVEMNLSYMKYEAIREKRIDEFYKEFDSRDKMLSFKRKMINKEPYILKKLNKNFPNVDEDTLIDYTICVRIAGTLSDKPYQQPYVKRLNRFKNETELLSLSQMGFVEPQALDYQHITFYSLPKFSDILRPHINDYLQEKLFTN